MTELLQERGHCYLDRHVMVFDVTYNFDTVATVSQWQHSGKNEELQKMVYKKKAQRGGVSQWVRQHFFKNRHKVLG